MCKRHSSVAAALPIEINSAFVIISQDMIEGIKPGRLSSCRVEDSTPGIAIHVTSGVIDWTTEEQDLTMSQVPPSELFRCHVTWL